MCVTARHRSLRELIWSPLGVFSLIGSENSRGTAAEHGKQSFPTRRRRWRRQDGQQRASGDDSGGGSDDEVAAITKK